MTQLMKMRDPFELGGMRELVRSFFDDARQAPIFGEDALAVDISEGKEGEIVVRASVPGFRKEDVKVSVHEGVLEIKAERNAETDTRNEKFYRKERRWGSMSRSIELPGQPADDGVDAELKGGVLTVKVKPAQGSQPRAIAVR